MQVFRIFLCGEQIYCWTNSFLYVNRALYLSIILKLYSYEKCYY